MVVVNWMRLGTYEFAIHAASFRYISQSWSGPGWDFNFCGRCVNDEAAFPYGAGLYTEAAPLPLAKAEDYTGIELLLPLPYDEESGEPFFGLNVLEEHEVSGVRLRFAERDGQRYRIEVTATVAKTVFGHPERLELSAWAEELPDHAYGV
jgi:hypothetical protein